jgi:uncharacterized integral membrane protein
VSFWGYDPGSAMSTPQTPKPSGAKRLRKSGSETARSGLLVVLAILITLFAVFNLDEVKVDWIFGSGRAPLIIVIVVSLLCGIVLTYFADRLYRRRR